MLTVAGQQALILCLTLLIDEADKSIKNLKKSIVHEKILSFIIDLETSVYRLLLHQQFADKPISEKCLGPKQYL